MSNEKISLLLGRDEALVLFELLAEYENQSEIKLPENVDRLALIRLHGALESSLVEPFQKEYRKLLSEARRRLNEQV
jgi:hypothetical protein